MDMNSCNVSMFGKATDTYNVFLVSVDSLLYCIKTGGTIKGIIEKIRQDPTANKKQKLELPVIMWQGTFSHRADSGVQSLSSLMCVGITAQIAFQVIYNIAVVTDSVPNTGIGLPFFSSGGTSLVMLLAEMGVMLSISRASDIVHIQNEAEAQKTTAQQIPFPAPHEQGPNRYTYNG